MSDEWEDHDSGPFCSHWADPSDCDELCKCGHKCCEHSYGSCNVEGCPCGQFEDPPHVPENNQ